LLKRLLKANRFCGLAGVQLLIIYYVAGYVVILAKKLINLLIVPPTTLFWAIWATVIEMAVCSFAIGLCARRILHARSAKWVWLLSAGWLAFGMIRFALRPPESVLVNVPAWRHFFALGTGLQWLMDFWNYTLTFVGGVAYSLGACVSELFMTGTTAAINPDNRAATSAGA
jgi:Na+-transporting NADH:ubiquinone oxidoreductase subunit NqrB